VSSLPGQAIVGIDHDSHGKSTYWVQQSVPDPAAHSAVTAGDTTPASSSWELVALAIAPRT
jgi:hypothetical protein